MKLFEKPPLSIEQQIDRLTSRGMIVRDKEIARHYLTYISYYRFCGYAIEFENRSSINHKRYRENTTFEKVLDHYIFDRKLRLHIIGAIERIEIAVRTIITNELATQHGSHWYLKP